MKPGETLLIAMVVVAACVVPADLLYTSRFLPRFKELEKQRIVTSNQLATAKIVTENLNHVRDLVYRNMDFAGQRDSVPQDSVLFDFLTACVGDLKMKLISVRPITPATKGRVTTYGYEIQLIGDFFSFGEFCSKMENSRRVMAMTSFEVTELSGEAQSAGGSSKAGKSTATGLGPGRKGVGIRLHLDTFRVRKS